MENTFLTLEAGPIILLSFTRTVTDGKYVSYVGSGANNIVVIYPDSYRWKIRFLHWKRGQQYCCHLLGQLQTENTFLTLEAGPTILLSFTRTVTDGKYVSYIGSGANNIVVIYPDSYRRKIRFLRWKRGQQYCCHLLGQLQTENTFLTLEAGPIILLSFTRTVTDGKYVSYIGSGANNIVVIYPDSYRWKIRFLRWKRGQQYCCHLLGQLRIANTFLTLAAGHLILLSFTVINSKCISYFDRVGQ